MKKKFCWQHKVIVEGRSIDCINQAVPLFQVMESLEWTRGQEQRCDLIAENTCTNPIIATQIGHCKNQTLRECPVRHVYPPYWSAWMPAREKAESSCTSEIPKIFKILLKSHVRLERFWVRAFSIGPCSRRACRVFWKCCLCNTLCPLL